MISRSPRSPSALRRSPDRPAREVFTVVTRGEEFSLSRSQVEFDSPNLFKSAFLDHDSSEARSRILETDRHPLLFAIILEHLSGYALPPPQSR